MMLHSTSPRPAEQPKRVYLITAGQHDEFRVVGAVLGQAEIDALADEFKEIMRVKLLEKFGADDRETPYFIQLAEVANDLGIWEDIPFFGARTGEYFYKWLIKFKGFAPYESLITCHIPDGR